MKLKITTPNGIIEKRHIEKIRIDGNNGQFMLKKRHLDMTSSFTPNLMKVWEKDGDKDGYYMGLGYGVCVKRKESVYISSFKVLEGATLEDMRDKLDDDFEKLQNSDAETRKALAYLESSMARYIYKT